MSDPTPAGMATRAVGSSALNIANYGDVAVRSRPSNSVLAQVIGALASMVGVQSLANKVSGPMDETAENRRAGLEGPLGYLVGWGVGAGYGLLCSHVRSLPVPVRSVALSLAAMTGSDVSIGVLDVSDPQSWGRKDRASDLGSHLADGLFSAWPSTRSPSTRGRR